MSIRQRKNLKIELMKWQERRKPETFVFFIYFFLFLFFILFYFIFYFFFFVLGVYKPLPWNSGFFSTKNQGKMRSSSQGYNRHETREKWPMMRDPGRSCFHRHTSVKLSWSQPMAPWTSAVAYACTLYPRNIVDLVEGLYWPMISGFCRGLLWKTHTHTKI